MGIHVSIILGNMGLINLNNFNGILIAKYFGHIATENFEEERDSISDDRIKQFLYISCGHITIYNRKQLIVLVRELEILEPLNIINKLDFEIIKNAVNSAIDSDSYVEFYYD